MIDYTLFVCTKNSHFMTFSKIMQILQVFFLGKLLWKVDEILKNFEFYFTAQIGFDPEESENFRNFIKNFETSFCQLNIF